MSKKSGFSHGHLLIGSFSIESRQPRRWVEMKCTTGNQEQVAKPVALPVPKNYQLLFTVAVGQ